MLPGPEEAHTIFTALPNSQLRLGVQRKPSDGKVEHLLTHLHEDCDVELHPDLKRALALSLSVLLQEQ